jgi:hypothetical protein
MDSLLREHARRGHGPMRNDSQQNLSIGNRQAAELEAAPKTEDNSARSGGTVASKSAARRPSEARKEKSADEARAPPAADRREAWRRGGEGRRDEEHRRPALPPRGQRLG